MSSIETSRSFPGPATRAPQVGWGMLAETALGHAKCLESWLSLAAHSTPTGSALPGLFTAPRGRWHSLRDRLGI